MLSFWHARCGWLLLLLVVVVVVMVVVVVVLLLLLLVELNGKGMLLKRAHHTAGLFPLFSTPTGG